LVAGTTELDEAAIGDWLMEIVRPVGGDVVERRIGEPWKIRDSEW
jgi:hypothetical protein